MRGGVVRLVLLVSVVSGGVAHAQTEPPLTVVTAQPNGEIAREQAAEIRVRFSEAMVIGRVPDTVPFLSIRPAIAGTFRWAGPTLLVFTPDPKTPLPAPTRYDVTIAAGATAVCGRRLARNDRLIALTRPRDAD